jgi:hypothetical protein
MDLTADSRRSGRRSKRTGDNAMKKLCLARAFSVHVAARLILPGVLALGVCITAAAQTFTVTNNCSYIVYPGIYPPVYQNGGWSLAPGNSVSFAPGNTFNGRIWGRIGCNSASPAQCATGQCGGTGVQCAGTTGQAGTSLAEFNLDASGTDWYDVSYVDGFDNPIGIQISNNSCTSPNSCTKAVYTSCPSGLLSGDYCLSPCTEFNTDQLCCRNAYGTSSTCIVSQWPAMDQQYVSNVHTFCPNQYAYPFDDPVGLHSCATGSNYTITFCPGAVILNGMHVVKASYNLNLAMDDFAASTAAGNKIDIYTVNGTGAQSWNFSNVNVVPAGDYNLAVSFGAYCVDVLDSGTASGTLIDLAPCDGQPNQAWNVVSSGSSYTLQPANAPSMCLTSPNATTTIGTQLEITTCSGNADQLWQID